MFPLNGIFPGCCVGGSVSLPVDLGGLVGLGNFPRCSVNIIYDAIAWRTIQDDAFSPTVETKVKYFRLMGVYTGDGGTDMLIEA